MTPTTDDYIRAAMSAFRAQRGERFIHAGGKGRRVRTPGERVLLLPNGQTVKVTVDDSGIATQVEEDDKLHAIVRPEPIRVAFSSPTASPSAAGSGHPKVIRSRIHIRK